MVVVEAKTMELDVEILDHKTNTTTRLTLRRELLTVGRHEDNDVVIPNEFVSRSHCRLLLRVGGSTIEDLQSANGTFTAHSGQWDRLTAPQALLLPASVRLGKEITLRLSTRDDTCISMGDTAMVLRTDIAPSLSQVCSIKELRRDETIMVLDLCESTRLAHQNEEMAFHLKRRLEAIAKFSLSACNVNFFKNTGDGFVATFAASADALKAAQAIIGSLAERNEKSPNPPIRVRIGLHRGVTYTIDAATRDVHGSDVNIAFRIEPLQQESFLQLKYPIPERNRILCSAQFYDDIKGQDIFETVVFHYCGSAQLKGIAVTVDIYLLQ
jgi:class 3 adenylate cyclase